VRGCTVHAQSERTVDAPAGVFGEPFSFRQLVDAQPFVEQKVEIAPRQQGGLHDPIFAETAGRSPRCARRIVRLVCTEYSLRRSIVSPEETEFVDRFGLFMEML